VDGVRVAVIVGVGVPIRAAVAVAVSQRVGVSFDAYLRSRSVP
jgi:hypothetical protein